MLEPERTSGGGVALAFCIGGAFGILVLLPTTQLLDPKAAAAMALAALFCLGFALPGSGSEHLRRPPAFLFLAWAAIGVAMGCSRAASPYRNLVSGVGEAAFAGVGICFCLAIGPRLWKDAVLRTWRWATLLLAAYALAQRLGFDPVAAYTLAGSNLRAMGSFGNPGYLAAFLCLSWPLFLVWDPARRAAALGLVFAALVATQSRAGLLALALQGALLGYARLRRAPAPAPDARPGGPRTFWERFAGGRLGSVVVAAVALGLIGPLAGALFPPVQWLRPTLRWPLWQAAFHLWLQRPVLGWGPGSFPLAFQDHASAALVGIVNAGNQYAEDPHQVLLAVACAGGLVGLAAFALGAWFFFREVGRSPLPEAPALGLGALGLFAQSQADRFFFLPGVFVPLCAAFGMLAWRAVQAGAADKEAKPKESLPGTAGTGLNLAFLTLAFVFAWRGFLPVLVHEQGTGSSLDAGVGALATAGNPAVLAVQAVHSGDPMAFERLGDSLAAEHRYAEAARAFGQSLVLQPTSGRAQNLGNCAMMLGDTKAAEAAFKRAVALDPSSSNAHFSLGYALFYQKRLKAAVVQLDMALRLDPANAGAAQLKRQILQ
jgi:O-antigen ligase